MKLLFTDDRPENIEGAHNAKVSIDAVHFKNGNQLTEEVIKRRFLKKVQK